MSVHAPQFGSPDDCARYVIPVTGDTPPTPTLRKPRLQKANNGIGGLAAGFLNKLEVVCVCPAIAHPPNWEIVFRVRAAIATRSCVRVRRCCGVGPNVGGAVGSHQRPQRLLLQAPQAHSATDHPTDLDLARKLAFPPKSSRIYGDGRRTNATG